MDQVSEWGRKPFTSPTFLHLRRHDAKFFFDRRQLFFRDFQLLLLLHVLLFQLFIVTISDSWWIVDVSDDELDIFVFGVLLQVLVLQLAEIRLRWFE